jgi:dipeptidyl-peptidase-4
MSFKNNKVAYTIENNVYVKDINSEEVQVTKDGKEGIVNGKAVHRYEFGIKDGLFWSPNSNYLAFYKKDETMVDDYPLVNVSTRIASAEPIKYPMAGLKSHHVTLGIFDVKTKKTIFIKTGEPKEQYLTNISWDPNEKYIYIAVLNRDQNHMKLNQYDVTTGDFVKTLFEEKNEKYVEPQSPLLFLENNKNQFIWQSQRDGYNHLYLYDTNGKLITQLTKGEWLVNEILGFDKKEQNIFISASKESPLEKHPYIVNLKKGTIKKLANAKGTHNTVLSPSGKYIFDAYSSTEVPKIYTINDIKGKEIKQLLKSEDKLKDYNLGEMTISTIKAADGKTDLYYRLIKPTNFDPNKKYPAIIYVYGGPHAQMVTDSWLGGVRLWQQYMASKGYVMLTVDNRASANRGFEFESVIHRQIGIEEVKDQMQGVKFLESLGYVDMEKIGVHGWSYGGFMTTTLMTRHNDVFKVGAAGGPVIDWKYYEIMYGERYMDSPEQNPEGYKNANLLHAVENLKGRLLIVHGAIDPTVVWQHSLAFVRECVKKGVLLDYFVYPKHEHNVRGKDRVHLMRKVTQYFDDFLK